MAVDFSGIARWPNVPACYEWLSLDRRGGWRLQGAPVTHHGLLAFINRQYGHDEAGRWFVQNGPQRVFVDLAYTPWVFRREGGALVAHTGEPAGDIAGQWLDDGGSLVLQTALGVGVLDDRDLAGFLAGCTMADGHPADDAALLALMAGDDRRAVFHDGRPLRLIAAVDVAKRFAFEPRPRP